MVSKQNLVSALDNVSYDKNVVLGMIDKHPDMVKMLSEAKDKDGKPLFDALAIDDILFNCKDTIEQHPNRIAAVLNNPEEIDSISSWKNRGAGLWRAVGDPLSSTIKQNPQAFGIKVESEQENKGSTTNTDSIVKSFSEYFAGYKNYDNGGELDQMIIADAKKVFETLKTPEAIQTFSKANYETQQKMVSGLDDGHSGFSFGCVCQCAYDYSTYAQKYIKDSSKKQSSSNEGQNITNRLAEARKKLARKFDEKLGTNLSDIKLPKKIKNIETKISKCLGKSGR